LHKFAICEHRAVWVISRRRLKQFWERHPQAEVPLRAWFQVASKAEWQHLVDVRRDFPHADAVGQWTVFNIGGNDFRLVVEIVYATHKVYIRFVGTHQEYDRGRWK
jgi:mRNA interferase HigB